MTEYEPDSLRVDGDAKTTHKRAESVIGDQLTGAVTSAEGDVSHIVTDADLSQSDLDALETEFGVAWSERD